MFAHKPGFIETFRSGHAAFAASGSRLVDMVMTTFVYNYQVFILSVVVIAICMVEVYFLIFEKLRSAMSTCMVLFSKQPGCNPIVEFRAWFKVTTS